MTNNLNIQLQNLYYFLSQKTNFLIIAHSNPDGDTLGATSALYSYLKSQNKKITLFCKDKPSQIFQYLNQYHNYTTDLTKINCNYDAIIIIDSANLKLCGLDNILPQLECQTEIINIDHHPSNTSFGTINILDSNASSASEIIGNFFLTNNITINPEIATSLLTGLSTDTTLFSNAATSSNSIELANKLLAQGAEFHSILQNIFNTNQINLLKIFGLSLQRLTHNKKYNLAYTWLTIEDSQKYNISIKNIKSFLINYLNSVIKEAEIILIITNEESGFIKGSLRSTKTDVNKIAKLFNGGGHKLASGFKIPGNIQIKNNKIKII